MRELAFSVLGLKKETKMAIDTLKLFIALWPVYKVCILLVLLVVWLVSTTQGAGIGWGMLYGWIWVVDNIWRLGYEGGGVFWFTTESYDGGASACIHKINARYLSSI